MELSGYALLCDEEKVILLGGFFRSVFCFLYLKIIFLHKNDSVMTNIEYRKISEIKRLDGNPRKISKEQMNILKESISKNADYFEARPIILSDRTGELVIIAGNQRYEACRQLGIETVPTVLLSGLTEEREREIIIRDNVNNGEWDEALLQEWDSELLADWGVDVSGWDDPETSTETEEDDFTEEDAESVVTRVKSGDIWKLGDHRLMCGDSTKVEDVEMLMNGEMADLWLTDPPYNVGYGMEDSAMMSKRKHRTDGKIVLNDRQDDKDFALFLTNAYRSAEKVMKCGASFYIFHADNEGYNFRGALRNTDGLQLKQTLIWLKDSLCLGRQGYQWIHEPCLYGWKSGASHNWYNDRKQTTVIKYDRPKKSEEHPTMKPVGLFGYLIGNSSKVGEIVLDSFGGSGTTLIACEQINRKARLMELDPHYCDVIIARWEKLTGKEAEKISEA